MLYLLKAMVYPRALAGIPAVTRAATTSRETGRRLSDSRKAQKTPTNDALLVGPHLYQGGQRDPPLLVGHAPMRALLRASTRATHGEPAAVPDRPRN